MQFTTLVPAYKPKYLVELLAALRHQTVKPARIIISDDSPDQAFVAALGDNTPLRQAVADMSVEVVPGPRTGAYDNFRALLQRFGGQTELFHLLLDDDIPYPTFYERHLAAHSHGRLQCAVSRRWTALDSGQPTRDLPVPPAIATHPQRMLALDAKLLFAHTAGVSANWLGEFSNATFHADMAPLLDDPSLDGICFTGLEDLGAFLKASIRAPLGYINEHLGYFRTSAAQHSADPMGRPMKLAHLAYIALTLSGRRLGLLEPAAAQTNLSGLCPVIVERYGEQDDMAALCGVMPALATGGDEGDRVETEFLALWHVYSGAVARKPLQLLMPPTLTSQPLISVFIPIYNGAQYISRTLDSLLAQSFQHFEVLCINDCSTDDSLAILQDYAARDPRVRVLDMDVNQGSVPKVLNKMLPEMRGNYFVYSSQDDLFSSDWLAKMHARAVETGADAVIPDLVFYYENEPDRCRSLIGLKGDRSVELTGRDAMVQSLDWTIPGNALWNAELIRRLGFADFAVNADEYSGRVFFMNCNKVAFSEGQFLYRQDNPDAITKRLTYKSFDMALTFFRLFELLRDNGFAPELYAREALKALRTLEQIQRWLVGARAQMTPSEIAEAETRGAVVEQLLRDSRLYDVFEASPSTETTS
jgi:glycosyltransferase involved in cell wall biosynthesis